MAALMVMVGLLVVLDVLAVVFGKDTRDGGDWSTHGGPARVR
jgi:hypothetical protein